MFHWLWVAILGLIVGALAKLIMPGKDPGGIIITMLLGIAGSLLGNWIGDLLRLNTGGSIVGFIWSIIGALIILAIYHFFKRRQATAH